MRGKRGGASKGESTLPQPRSHVYVCGSICTVYRNSQDQQSEERERERGGGSQRGVAENTPYVLYSPVHCVARRSLPRRKYKKRRLFARFVVFVVVFVFDSAPFDAAVVMIDTETVAQASKKEFPRTLLLLLRSVAVLLVWCWCWCCHRPRSRRRREGGRLNGGGGDVVVGKEQPAGGFQASRCCAACPS